MVVISAILLTERLYTVVVRERFESLVNLFQDTGVVQALNIWTWMISKGIRCDFVYDLQQFRSFQPGGLISQGEQEPGALVSELTGLSLL